MGLMLSQDEEMVRQTAREFAEKRLKPLAEKFDEEEAIPRELYAEAADLGFFGILIPEEFGGLGLDYTACIIVMEEIARVSAAFEVTLTVHNSLVSTALVNFCNEEQKKAWLPKLAKGEWIAAYSLSEQGSGSDAGSLRCAAAKEPDGWRLKGGKAWVSSAGIADFFIVFVSTDPANGNKGISCLAVTKGMEGMTLGKKEKKLGIRGSDTREIHFAGTRVPAFHLIGEINQGFKIAMTQLDGGRIGIAAQAVGIAQAAMEEAVSYAKTREQFGKKLAEFQATQFKLADMAVKVEAARLMTLKAARLMASGQKATQAASMAKLLASQTANQVAYDALQIHGGNGYIREFPVERYFRDARITEIYEGTSEIQRLVIAREILRG
ncbi:MAG: acyl-CoA dehydrogenase family protein [Elusimicrobia bacterium]|nr:acyl-CoA dehydrogenase family protein [Elusimicrobiota bacterium]